MNTPFKIITLFFLTLLLCATYSEAQRKVVIGYIKDKQSDEPIPFASAMLKKSRIGVLTDSSGKFLLSAEVAALNDSLIISGIGYKVQSVWAGSLADSIRLEFRLVVLPVVNDVVVKSKYNRALWFWKRIMKYKPLHDKTRWDNYSYEIYNKLELDIENLNTKKLSNNALLKPLNFVFNYIDSTSEERPFLPAYLTETLSDYYFQKTPHKVREVIKATRTNGLDNESVIKQLGGLYQNINVYDNFIPVFNREFISPFNTNAPNYYNFKLLDTQYLSNRRLVHLKIIPKHKGDDVFEGDCWIHDTTFAVQKITLRPSVDANINFLSGLSLIQEFRLINDTTWFLYKDKFVADISPIGKKNLALKGRKTTTYKNVLLDTDSTISEVNKSKVPEKVELAANYDNSSDSFWQKRRHEELSKSEKSVYILLDTLEKNRTYLTYRNTITFLTTGTKDIGNIRLGPWYYWISGNPWEGTRLRFDLATNTDFDKHLHFQGYGAYGTSDQRFKGKLEAKYLFSRDPWCYLSASYKNDLDNGQVYYDQLASDNIFATLFRRAGVPFKFQSSVEKKLEFNQETNKNIGFVLSATSKQYESLKNLPSKADFFTSTGDPFNSFEASIKFKYAYAERTIEQNFIKYSLGSDKPIVELQYTRAFKNVLNSGYQYDKVNFSIANYQSVAPYGKIYYNLFAGKIYGAAPFNFLQVVPGNEQLYYNKYAFNLMNRFEFITDSYAGFNLEHKIGSGIFKYIPLTRKLKWRQLWNLKGVVGTLSEENKALNFVGTYPYKSLDGKLYTEVGTGIDNIFKIFRVDFVWRLWNGDTNTQKVDKFGVFGTARFTF